MMTSKQEVHESRGLTAYTNLVYAAIKTRSIIHAVYLKLKQKICHSFLNRWRRSEQKVKFEACIQLTRVWEHGRELSHLVSSCYNVRAARREWVRAFNISDNVTIPASAWYIEIPTEKIHSCLKISLVAQRPEPRKIKCSELTFVGRETHREITEQQRHPGNQRQHLYTIHATKRAVVDKDREILLHTTINTRYIHKEFLATLAFQIAHRDSTPGHR